MAFLDLELVTHLSSLPLEVPTRDVLAFLTILRKEDRKTWELMLRLVLRSLVGQLDNREYKQKDRSLRTDLGSGTRV